MTALGDRWITAHEWAQIVTAVGLASGAGPADIVAALVRSQAGKAAARSQREARAAAIQSCRCCDPCGWRLGPDGLPVEPATRCQHRSDSELADRDVTVPLHEPPIEAEARCE